MAQRRRPRYYVLDGKRVVPVPGDDVRVWGRWLESEKHRHVAISQIGAYRVSTVFLGLDHSFRDDGPPLLFETMVFHVDHQPGQEMLGICERCSTWKEAEKQHDEVCRAVAAKLRQQADEIDRILKVKAKPS